jgi:hypothetical protein
MKRLSLIAFVAGIGSVCIAAEPAAASGAWTADDTFTAKICFYETPFITTVPLKFSGDQLLVDSESNVGSDSTKQSQLTGKAVTE